ncbi:hypothetical protein HK098_001295 [Nowakowskiella sp. JEL0407]|nr:hypothetical protein HK098_001295 [Nowakowskiella sp. JEL0407]
MFDDQDEEAINAASSTVILSVISFSTVGLLCFLIFCGVRTQFKDIYSPRRVLKVGAPPKLPTGYFNWIPVVYNIPESFIISTVGLDAAMFLRFLKMGYQLFGVLTILGIGIIAPVNYFSSTPEQPIFHKFPRNFNETVFIRAISVANVPAGSKFLNVHLIFTWIFSFVSYAFIIRFYRSYVQLKQKYTEHMLRKTNLMKIELRTIMVYGIPTSLRHEVDLAAYFESLNLGRVEQVVLCRRWTQLRRAVSLRAYYLHQVETILTNIALNEETSTPANHGKKYSPLQWFAFLRGLIRGNTSLPAAPNRNEREIARETLSKPDTTADENDVVYNEIIRKINSYDPIYRPTHRTGSMGLFGEVVDSAEYYLKQFKVWDRKVVKLRDLADTSTPTSVGFVTFESPQSAVLAAQAVLDARPFACMAKLAPEPRDIYWANLSSMTANPFIKLLRTAIVLFTLTILVLFSVTIITAVVTPLSNLKSFADSFPWTRPFIDSLSPSAVSFVESVISPVVLATWTGSLPTVLLTLTQLQGLEAESWIENGVLAKYWFYNFFNYFLLPVTTGTLLNLMAELPVLIETPGKIIELLGKGVVARAPQLINYVMLSALAVYPASLLLVAPIVLTWLFRISPWAKSSPRAVSDTYYPSLMTSFNYGISYPMLTIVFTIGITYAPIAPIALPFCFLYFMIAYAIFKYIYLYVHIPKYETGGLHVPIVIRRCLWGMWVMQLAVGGCLAIKSLTDKSPSVLAAIVGLTWTKYAETIISVFPLTVINFSILWWFRNGYEKLVKNVPLETVTDVAAEVKNAEQKKLNRTVSSGRMVVAAAAAFSKRALMGSRSSSDSLSKGKDIASVAKERVLSERQEPQRSESSSSNSPSPTPREPVSPAEESKPKAESFEVPTQGGSENIITTSIESAIGVVNAAVNNINPNENKQSDDGMVEGANDTKVSIAEALETTVLLPSDIGNTEEVIDASTPINYSQYVLLQHLEPPMTRVPGVLDAPIESATPVISETDWQPLWKLFPDDEPHAHGHKKGFSATASSSSSGTAVATKHVSLQRNDTSLQLGMPEDEEKLTDLILLSYLPPAVIGRLPVFWLPESQEFTGQPQALMKEREKQISQQREMWRRIVLRQRVGINELEAERTEWHSKTYLKRSELRKKRMEAAKMAGSAFVEDVEEDDSYMSDSETESIDSDDEVGSQNGDVENGDETTSLLRRRKRRANKKNWRNSTVLSGIRNFTEGVSSWAHLQIS